MPEAAVEPKPTAGPATAVLLVAGEEAFTHSGTVDAVLKAAVAEGHRLAGEGHSSSMRVTVGDDVVAQGEFIAIDSALPAEPTV